MDRFKLRMLSALLCTFVCAFLCTQPLAHAAGTITVTPVNESVVVGGTRQFTATVSGLANPAVIWAVEGIAGGNST